MIAVTFGDQQASAIELRRAPLAGPNAALPDIRGLTLADLEGVIEAVGEEPFRARQLATRLYRQGADGFDQMSELPAGLRQYLKEHFKIGSILRTTAQRARDGTRKLLLGLEDGELIESVIIAARDRVTLCLSSQVGCALGCSFCATARMGLHRNLTAGEILEQIFAARRELGPGELLTNCVFMGMGEPLANYASLLAALRIMTAPWGLAISPRRITVSTVGLAPMIEKLLSEIPVHLAISLHATTDELRERLMPINRRYPLKVLLEACRSLPVLPRRRMSFEYLMLKGVNDSRRDAERLVSMVGPLRAKINLIFFNPFEGVAFESSSRRAVEDFQAILQGGNLTATIRESRGRDIAAACGQLYAECSAPDGAGHKAKSARQKGSPGERRWRERR